MKITITPGDLAEIDGVAVRHWIGETDQGTPCNVFVHRIAPEPGQEAEFAAELQEKSPPQNTPPMLRRPDVGIDLCLGDRGFSDEEDDVESWEDEHYGGWGDY